MPIDEIILKEIPCNYCGSNDNNILFERGDLNTSLTYNFTVVRCNQCGLSFLNPRPTHENIIHDIYPENYDQYLDDLPKYSLRWLSQRFGFHKRYKYISKFKSSGRLLDVGCATGDFLAYIQEQSEWDVEGLEPIINAAKIARDKVGKNKVQTKSIVEFKAIDRKFDVITFWHVFEHLEDPLLALKSAKELLKDEGIIIITLPMLDSIDHKVFGENWIGYELPRHLYFFSRKMMEKYLIKSGYKLIGTKCLYGSHAMTITSIKFLLKAKTQMSEKLINSIFRFLDSIIIRLLFFPLFFFFDKLQISTPMTFVAEKC